jgi:hypothetical protein
MLNTPSWLRDPLVGRVKVMRLLVVHLRVVRAGTRAVAVFLRRLFE